MSNTATSQNATDPVHPGLILAFTRCPCTYYYTTPHQIPKDESDPPPEGEPSRMCVPGYRVDDKTLTTWMLARQARIEGNCRMHDMELVLGIVRADWRSDDDGEVDYTWKAEDSNPLPMVRSETAHKYRVMSLFNARWTASFHDFIDEKKPIDSVSICLGGGASFTEEEKEKFSTITSWHSIISCSGASC